MTQSTHPLRDTKALASVRYLVSDVERALAFYTERLGFRIELKAGAAFASVVLDSLRVLLSGPASSGARPLPDGTAQRSGGDNRIVIYVDDLEAKIATLRQQGVVLRNQVEAGPGGRQIQIQDPDGNSIELHEAPH